MALDVSLVIPVRNEAEHLGELIASITQQEYPPAEILLVDGGSTDGTPALARRLTAGDSRFRVVEAGPATPGRGRNIGIDAARHEWVALTDAGIRLEADWLKWLVSRVQADPGAGVVYGAYFPVEETFFERCAALAYVAAPTQTPDGVLRGRFIASSIVRRSAWQAVGGFPDLRAAEDLMFMERLTESGFREAWEPRARVWWRVQPTLGRTFRRFLLYSRFNVLAGRQRFWHYGVARQYAAGAPFVALGIFGSPWWFAVPAAALAARVARRIWQRRAGRPWAFCLNPAQFGVVALIVLVTDLATLAGWAWARLGTRKS